MNYLDILNRILDRMPTDIDKRTGSIAFDATAPASMEIANLAALMEIFYEQTYLLTATGNNLDKRGGDFAIARFQATKALRIGRMYDTTLAPATIEIGARFATPTATGGIPYVVVQEIEIGLYILECEIPGTVGNEYYGDLLPLFISNRLGRAEITGTQIPARDVETDDDYRERIKARMKAEAFGGNIADYKRFTKEIEGVGDVRVFPVWDGGGTVLLSVVDSSYNSISQPFKDLIKEKIDPVDATGTGVGIAPIGHVVTVTTPEAYTINIEASITLDNRTIGQVQYEIETNIKDYFHTVRRNWADSDKISIFNVMIASAIIKVERVINVTDIKLNGVTGDLVLSNTAALQQLPYLGVVTLHEA